MMNRTVKLLITLAIGICLSLVIIFNDVVWSIVLLSLLFVKGWLLKFLLVIKNFFFKKGIVSYATIAWKKVFVSSSFALSKRAIINTVSGFFQNRIVKPLIHPLTRYLRVRWRIFKASSLWKKTVTIIFGSIPASLLVWLVGIADAIALLMKSFSLAKFLTLLLKFITVFLLFFKNIWNNWIQPYIDVILITVFVTYIEKIPYIGNGFRRLRISLKWQLRGLKKRRKHIVKNHIDAPVTLLSEKIHKHVDKKKEDLSPRETNNTKANNADAVDVKDNTAKDSTIS